MFQTEVVEKIKTQLMFNNLFFFQNRAVYERMWKTIVELDRPRMTIWRMVLHVGYLRLQTHTQNMQYVLLFLCNND